MEIDTGDSGRGRESSPGRWQLASERAAGRPESASIGREGQPITVVARSALGRSDI